MILNFKIMTLRMKENALWFENKVIKCNHWVTTILTFILDTPRMLQIKKKWSSVITLYHAIIVDYSYFKCTLFLFNIILQSEKGPRCKQLYTYYPKYIL